MSINVSREFKLRILVTGSAGFIGAALSLKLLQRGDEVIGLDNLNDEQHRLSAFWAQPEGTGPFFPLTTLHLAYAHHVHGARCAMSWKKMASVAAIG